MSAARSTTVGLVLSTATDLPDASASSIMFRCRSSRLVAFGHRSLLTCRCVLANFCRYKELFPAPGKPIRITHSRGGDITQYFNGERALTSILSLRERRTPARGGAGEGICVRAEHIIVSGLRCRFRRDLRQDGERLLDVLRNVELRCPLGDCRSCRGAAGFVRPEFQCPRQRGDVVWKIDNRAMDFVLDDFAEAIGTR